MYIVYVFIYILLIRNYTGCICLCLCMQVCMCVWVYILTNILIREYISKIYELLKIRQSYSSLHICYLTQTLKLNDEVIACNKFGQIHYKLLNKRSLFPPIFWRLF